MPLVDGLASFGRRGRFCAAKIDLVVAGGPAYYLQRLRARRRYSELGAGVRHAFYERMWSEAAVEVGARVTTFAPGSCKLTRGLGHAEVFHQEVGLDDPLTILVALDKQLVHRTLASAGLPAPEHVSFHYKDPAPALGFLAENADGCVVKPARGTGGGNGTTAGIQLPGELLRACRHAAVSSDELLIERQAMGSVYRLLLLDGQLLDVVRSDPQLLTADGQSTVADLIHAENERRVAARGAAGLSRIGISCDMLLTLKRSGLSLASTPRAGTVFPVRTITNGSSADHNETWTGPVADSVLADARAAANAVGLRLAGVDVITPDIGRPLREVDGVINEVNGNPGLHHHYLVAAPERATRVAVPILEHLLEPQSA